MSALLLLAGALPLVQHVCAEDGAALAWMARGCCCEDAPTPSAGAMDGGAMAHTAHTAHGAPDAGCPDAPTPPSDAPPSDHGEDAPDACCSVSTLAADLTATPAVPADAAPVLLTALAPAIAANLAPAPPASPGRPPADPPPPPSVRLHLLVATFLT